MRPGSRGTRCGFYRTVGKQLQLPVKKQGQKARRSKSLQSFLKKTSFLSSLYLSFLLIMPNPPHFLLSVSKHPSHDIRTPSFFFLSHPLRLAFSCLLIYCLLPLFIYLFLYFLSPLTFSVRRLQTQSAQTLLFLLLGQSAVCRKQSLTKAGSSTSHCSRCPCTETSAVTDHFKRATTSIVFLFFL